MVNRKRRAPEKRPRRARLALDERRAQLLDAGRALFNRRAYEEISIDDIAEAVGVSKGLLYHYFPSKRRFFVEVVRLGAEQMLALTEPAGDDALPFERLRLGLDAYLRYVEGNARAFAMLMRTGVGVDASVRAILERARKTLVERIVRGIGDVPAPMPPALRLALRGWIGMVEAASLDWVEHERDLPRGVLRDALASVFAVTLESTLAGGAFVSPLTPLRSDV